MALVDVYDALTSDRVYKKAFPHEKAMHMILDGDCGAFNPLLIDCLIDLQDRIVAEKDEQDSPPPISVNDGRILVNVATPLIGKGAHDGLRI